MQKLIDKVIEAKKERMSLIYDIQAELKRIYYKVSELEQVLDDVVDSMPRPKPSFAWQKSIESCRIPTVDFYQIVSNELPKSSIFELKQIKVQVAGITDKIIEDVYCSSVG